MDRSARVSSALSWLWSPLVVVTAAFGGRRSGQVAVSVQNASIVPDRPRLIAGLWKGNLTRDLAERSGAFAVHVLRADQDEMIEHFGLQSGHDVDKLSSHEFIVGETGSPLLADCMAVYECRVVNAMDAGDHTVFLGDVVLRREGAAAEPLWWRELRTRLPASWEARWESQSARAVEIARTQMDRVERG
jgi:flavin reductase (NADH)